MISVTEVPAQTPNSTVGTNPVRTGKAYVFRWDGPPGSIELSPGTHEVRLIVLGGDGSGVEIDLVSLEILR